MFIRDQTSLTWSRSKRWLGSHLVDRLFVVSVFGQYIQFNLCRACWFKSGSIYPWKGCKKNKKKLIVVLGWLLIVWIYLNVLICILYFADFPRDRQRAGGDQLRRHLLHLLHLLEGFSGDVPPDAAVGEGELHGGVLPGVRVRLERGHQAPIGTRPR